ncbi:uncharacterized protein [Heterodontus francisci]|uniref:uncharacterized protein n=1 Tax=Heterodontus francisci TaxID=7792 RepID=UPI00355B54C8
MGHRGLCCTFHPGEVRVVTTWSSSWTHVELLYLPLPSSVSNLQAMDQQNQKHHTSTSESSEHSAHSYLSSRFLKRSGIESQDESRDKAPAWSFSRQLGKWKKSQSKRVQFDQMVKDTSYREFLKRHELEMKATLPLPLITAMEQEVLHILEESVKDYQQYLGNQHNLTQQMRHRIRDLRLTIERKGVLNEVYRGRCTLIREFFRQFLGGN